MGPPLTSVSSHDAKVVVAIIVEGNTSKPDYKRIPSVAFTVPPNAVVALTEAKARAQGLKFRMKGERAENWFAAQQQAERVPAFKVLVEEESDLVLGAHLVGPHADEVIDLSLSLSSMGSRPSS
jgi:glutathione reductase (NADPH)